LKPLLEKYSVAMYLSGHDHNMQHLKQNGVHYVLVGAGHELKHKQEHETSVPNGVAKYFWPSKDISDTGAFGIVQFNDEKTLNVNYVDSNLKTLYTFTVNNHRMRK